jgi:glycine/D-amino acid oxidase-like deaminating enzyme
VIEIALRLVYGAMSLFCEGERMPKNWGSRPWTIDFTPARKGLPTAIDLAVVGGGFTGLAAAAWFKTHAPEKSVALFEADTVGAGSSGHTGGMVLAETAVGDLPGLGDVLTGYQEILAKLGVQADLQLPGVYELGRKQMLQGSPICWNDSGDLGVVKEVPGGSINPGKVVSGLARSAEAKGVLLFEHAAVREASFGDEIFLVSAVGETKAKNVLFATNAFAFELNGLKGRAESAFTTAIMTEPLSEKTISQAGLGGRKPFYTVDLPYLWGKFLGNSLILGSGLVFLDDWRQLNSLNIDEGEALILYDKLEKRIGKLHPAFADVNFTHRWGGPICIAEEWKPVFEYHPHSKNAIVLGAYSGHGVAQSVYLGAWAADAFLGKRKPPNWK